MYQSLGEINLNIVEQRLEEIKKMLKHLPLESNSVRTILLSEAFILERFLQRQEIVNEEILDFFLKEGLITIKEKENLSIKWDKIHPKDIGELSQ